MSAIILRKDGVDEDYDEITCPYCGTLQTDEWKDEPWGLYGAEIVCANCMKTFLVKQRRIFRYYAEKDE